jgi:hypothetical protein
MVKLHAMFNVLAGLVGAPLSFFKDQRELALENLALRHTKRSDGSQKPR